MHGQRCELVSSRLLQRAATSAGATPGALGATTHVVRGCPWAAEVNPELLTTFYPTLSAIMLDVMLRQAEAEEAAEGGEALPSLEPGKSWPTAAAFRSMQVLGSQLGCLQPASSLPQPQSAGVPAQPALRRRSLAGLSRRWRAAAPRLVPRNGRRCSSA